MKFLLPLLVLLGVYIAVEYKRQAAFDEVLSLYQAGLLEKDVFLKDRALNGVLEKTIAIRNDSSAKEALLGDLLWELRQIPLAFYHYLEALSLDPHSAEIRLRLANLAKSESLTYEERGVAFSKWSQFGMILLFFTLLLCRFYKLAILGLIPLVLIGANFYLRPIQGVTIKSSMLYEAPDANAPYASASPLAAGALVSVLDAPKEGKWIKVVTSTKVMGYLQESSIRVLH